MSSRVRLGVDGQGYYVAHGPDGERVHVHRLSAVAEYGGRRVVGNDVHHVNRVVCDNSRENLSVRDPDRHRRANLVQFGASE